MNWGDENLMEEDLKIKSEIRKRIKTNIAENINILPLESKLVCEKILDSEEYKKAYYIFAYMALNDEVDLSLLIQKALSENKTVAIPKINRENMTMNFFHYHNQKSETADGYCKIKEPVDDAKIIDIEKLQNHKVLILVPGRAFTEEGGRLGRGKGFYDKYLAKLLSLISSDNVFLLGVAFSCQIVKELPLDNHDILMNKVVHF